MDLMITEENQICEKKSFKKPVIVSYARLSLLGAEKIQLLAAV